jgi:hypothetical protein
MLNYIHLENFRAFGQPTTIPLAPITLFFGENSAGKTSILHALSLLKQSAETDDPEAVLVVRDPRGLVDLGSFEELIFDHDLDRVLRIGIGWQDSGHGPLRRTGATKKPSAEKRNAQDLAEPARSVGKEWSFRFRKESGIEWESMALCDGLRADPLVRLRLLSERQDANSDEQGAELRAFFDGMRSFGLSSRDVSPGEFELARSLLFRYRADFAKVLANEARSARPSSVWPGRNQAALARLSSVVERMKQDEPADEALAAFLEESWRGKYRIRGWRNLLFGDTGIVDLLRMCVEPERREAVLADLSRSVLLAGNHHLHTRDLGAQHVLSRFSPIGPFRQPAERLYTHTGVKPRGVGRRGELVADMLRGDTDALERTNEWLRAFGIHYRVRLRALGARRSDVFEVRLQDTRRGGRLDVAFTDVGFGISQMLPIVVQCVGTKSRVISIEQPEVHIHPRLQAEIGDLLVECVRLNGHQFLIETHSEHLILRLRRLVREGKVKPDEIAVIYVDRGREGSTAQRIGVKPDGTFDREWPGGFFPERMKELL